MGILALLSIEAAGLTAIALIVFGAALVLSSGAVWHLYTLKHAAMTSSEAEPMVGTEVLASQMASGSAGIQAIAGIAAVVLGILALAGTGVDSVVLILVGLLIVGITIVLSGSAWSGTVMSFMRETPEAGRSPVTSTEGGVLKDKREPCALSGCVRAGRRCSFGPGMRPVCRKRSKFAAGKLAYAAAKAARSGNRDN